MQTINPYQSPELPPPETAIKFHCARCAQLLRVPEEALGKNARCPECQQLMRIPQPRVNTDAESVSIDETRPGLPWEAAPRKSLGVLIQTARLICLRPAEAFSRMKQGGNTADPIVYSLICLAFGAMGTAFWDSLATLGFLAFRGAPASEYRVGMLSVLGLAAGYLLVGVPLMATVGNLMHGGILHLCLLLCGGSRRPFATSFRIACYSHSSLMWLLFLPGGALGVGVWNLILTIFAIHKAHEVPMGRAVFTAILPMLVVGGLVVIIGIIVVGWFVYLLTNI